MRTTEYTEKPPVSENKSRRVWAYFENLRPGAEIKAINYIQAGLAWAVEYADGKYDSVRFGEIPTSRERAIASLHERIPVSDYIAPDMPAIERRNALICQQALSGKTQTSIAKEHGISFQRVGQIVRRAGVVVPKPPPAPVKAIQEFKKCARCSNNFSVGKTQQMQKYCSIRCKRAVNESRRSLVSNGERA